MTDDLSHFADYEETPALVPQVHPKFLDVPAEMVLKIAGGMDDPLDIAKSYGFSAEEFGALCQWEPFQLQVKAKKSELAAGGYTFRVQNAFYAEEVGKKLFMRTHDPELSTTQLLDAYRTFTKFADLEPRPNQPTQTGPAFSININLAQPAAKTITVENGA